MSDDFSAAGEPAIDLVEMTVEKAQAGFAERSFTSAALAQAFLDRIAAYNPHYNAIIFVNPDALADAREIDRRRATGEALGPLAGVPVVVKDTMDMVGLPSTGGWSLLCSRTGGVDLMPGTDSPVVARMRAAGAVILGKTNVPEFGFTAASLNMIFPPTRNPWNTELTAGGSSSGSGAAVAAGIGPFAVGGDGGGSIRIPAAINGVYGLKGSMGRVPLYPGTKDERYPGVSSWESLEHIGPLSRTVADAALMMSVIAGPDDRDRATLPEPAFEWMDVIKGDIRGLKVAYSPDLGYAVVDPEVREICGRAAQVFENSLGCHVETTNPGWADPFGSLVTIIKAETDLSGMRKLIAKYRDQISPGLADWLMAPLTDEQISDATMGRKAIANASWKFMRRYDLLLTPTVAVPAFPYQLPGPETIDGQKVGPFQWIAFTGFCNVTGQPAASVPAGFTKAGLPVGLQIVGRHLGDATVLRASAAFEAASPWQDKWPAMVSQKEL